MIGKLLLAAAGLATGASLSEETKGKIKDAARSVKGALGAATKDVRARAKQEWGRVTKYVREELLDEEPARSAGPAPS